MIVNLIGPSGSGKSSVAIYLNSWYSTVYSRLITYTTRLPRVNETHGCSYFFVNEIDISSTNDYVLRRIRKDGTYAVRKSDLEESRKSHLLTTFPPKGVLKLEALGYRVCNFYLLVSFNERRRRMNARGDSASNIQVRLLRDESEADLTTTVNMLRKRKLHIVDARKLIEQIATEIHSIMSGEIKD